ncbi:uncharacterized protein RHOBADRAFT_56140, partial [Rhodotorula graminis WP1]
MRVLGRLARRPALVRLVRLDDDELADQRHVGRRRLQLVRRPVHLGGPRVRHWHGPGRRVDQATRVVVGHRHPPARRLVGRLVRRPLDLQPVGRARHDGDRPRPRRERLDRLVGALGRFVAGPGLAGRRERRFYFERRSSCRAGRERARRRRRRCRAPRLILPLHPCPSSRSLGAGSAFLSARVATCRTSSTTTQVVARGCPFSYSCIPFPSSSSLSPSLLFESHRRVPTPTTPVTPSSFVTYPYLRRIESLDGSRKLDVP